MSSQPVRAVRYHRTGEPSQVVQVDQISLAEPRPGEARVRMLWAPVNPADLNMLEGKYGEARPPEDRPIRNKTRTRCPSGRAK